MSKAPHDPGISSVSMEQVFALAKASRDIIRNQGHLPAELEVEEHGVGTGSLLHLFSRVYLDIVGQGLQNSYEVIPFDSYPRENEELIISEVEGYKNWIVHRTDLDMSFLADMTRMQLWTLKPAHEVR